MLSFKVMSSCRKFEPIHRSTDVVPSWMRLDCVDEHLVPMMVLMVIIQLTSSGDQI